MKYLLSLMLIFFSLNICQAQNRSLSYEDVKFLLHNNLEKADTFFTVKNYNIIKKDGKNKNRKYSLTIPGGTYINVAMRLDGKKLFIEIETNELEQYNLIHESIAQFVDKDATIAGVQAYSVKGLGSIYITVDDSSPDPLKKDYDIQIVADKHITVNNQ